MPNINVSLHPLSVNDFAAPELSAYPIKNKDRLDKHRAQTDDVMSMCYQAPSTLKHQRKLLKMGGKMGECSTWLDFRWMTKDGGENYLKLMRASFCKNRHCPMCAWRRAMRNCVNVFNNLDRIEAEYPKARWLFLTLTVKNCKVEDTKATITAMNKAWHKLIRQRTFPALGFIKAVEVTRAPFIDDKGEVFEGAHPHFHVLLMVKPSYFKGGNYFNKDRWAASWQQVLGVDYTPIVDIRTTKPKQQVEDEELRDVAGNMQNGLRAAVVETLKYATKVEDMMASKFWFYTMVDQLHKMRFLSSGGALRGILQDEKMTDEELAQLQLETKEALENADVIGFNWSPTQRKYKRASRFKGEPSTA